MLEQSRQKLESEQRFRALIENGKDLILVLDAKGICRYASPSQRRILGYAIAEVIGQSFFDLIHPDDVPFLAQTFYQALHQPRVHTPVAEYRLQHSQGSWCTFEAVFTNLIDHPAVKGMVLNSHDITERKHSEAALQDALQAAEAANRAKSVFLTNMSHELRTPLSVILGYSDVLLEEMRAMGEQDLMSDLQQIRAAGTHLLTLINDLLEISKLEAGQVQLYLETFSVEILVLEVEHSIQPFIQRNENSFEMAIEEGIDCIKADAAKLRQLLLHLLNNAAKFTQRGLITLSVVRAQSLPSTVPEKETSQDLKTQWIVFHVKDTGIGIPEEYIPHLFDAFTQVDPSNTRTYGGTGLGLAICRRLCDMMGGHILVESQVDAGSTFSVYLPQEVEKVTNAEEVNSEKSDE